MEDSHFLDIEEAPDLELAHSHTMKEKLFSLPIDKVAIQKMVLDYLGEQAYYQAWRTFEQETLARLPPLPLLQERDHLRKLVESGEFLAVVEKASAISPFIFADFPGLFFLVVRQDILEDVYVRKRSEGSAVLRVEKELAAMVEKNPLLLPDLESLVGEIVFNTQTQERVLQQRAEVFQELNRKILHLLDYEIKDTLKTLFTKIKDLSAKHRWIKEIKMEVLQNDL